MKKIIFLIFVGLIFISCDRVDYYPDNDASINGHWDLVGINTLVYDWNTHVLKDVNKEEKFKKNAFYFHADNDYSLKCDFHKTGGLFDYDKQSGEIIINPADSVICSIFINDPKHSCADYTFDEENYECIYLSFEDINKNNHSAGNDYVYYQYLFKRN